VVGEQLARANELGIEMACEPASAPIWIDADPAQIEVALYAICDNALDSVPKGGRVRVEVHSASAIDVPCFAQGEARHESPRSWAEVTIADSGPGISPEVRRHLFDPFYSGRTAGRGLGFGLAKCWRIVTNHGGTVIVADHGELGGATFTIRLPAARLRTRER
jgi:signal transduction histidine kinase